MKKLSKRFRSILNDFDISSEYTPEQAINLLKTFSSVKFVETVEAHIHLNINTKYSDQQLRSTLILPYGTGKTIKLAVLLPTEKISPQLVETADIIGDNELIDEITSGNIDFDILLTIPSMMPKVAKLGRILGPRGLMPTPKAGTVVELDQIVEVIDQFKKGKIEYRADKTGIVHSRFGKSNFTTEHLLKNLTSLYDSIVQNKPKGVKGKYIKSFYICNTMSPSIKLDVTQL